MKRLAILLLLLPFIFAGSCKQDVEPKSDAISAIPTRSAFVVRVNDLHELALNLEASIPGNAIKKSILFANVTEFVALVNEVRINKEKNIQAFGGYDQYGAGSFGWIWCMEVEALPSITEAALASQGTVNSRQYGSSKIVHFTNEDFGFYFAHQNGLLLISKEENLVEASLKQLESGIDLTSDTRFMESLKTTSSKDPVNVFVQYNSLPDWLESVLETKTEWPSHLATWSAFDLDINENDINFTGISLVPDSAATYVGLFKNCGSGSTNFSDIIPENAALAVSQSCGEVDVWYKNFQKYLGRQNKLKTHQNQLAALQVDAKSWIDFTDEEIGVFYSEGTLTSAQSKNGFIRIIDAEQAIQTISKSSSNFNESYRDISLRKINGRHALPLIYGKLFSHLSEPYWFIYGNWAIFCNDLSNAKSTINNLLAEKTWANYGDYENVNSLRDGNVNIIAIAHNPEWLNLAIKELEPDLGKDIAKNKEAINAVNWAMVQLKQNGDAAYSEVVLVHQTVSEGSAKQYWGVELEGKAISNPQLVLNHNTKANEVVVQDGAHNLYLIDAKGQVLWKRKLNGPILGEITQIDMFKNNKLQLVFNTAEMLYLIDRNGKDVAPFPVKLPQNATAPMAAVDYDKNRNYRLLIPCGKNLYNYTIDGKQVKGWDFTKAKSDLVEQPKHAVIGSKDFIYTIDAAGSVYVLNRKGQIREPIKNKLSNLSSAIYLVGDKTEGGKLSALGKSGYTLSLFLKDHKDSIQPFGNKPQFMFADSKMQLFGADNELYVRSDALNLDIELEEAIAAEPRVYKIGGATYFVVSTDKKQIWIFDSQGKALPGMPLYGSGIAALGRTNGKDIHAIVATDEGALVDYKLAQ